MLITGQDTPEISHTKCECKAGQGICSHLIGLLYILVHYQRMDYVSVPSVISKTSLPQTWNVPQRKDGIEAAQVNELKIAKIKPKSEEPVTKKIKRDVECVSSTLYCPVKRPVQHDRFHQTLLQNLGAIGSDAQYRKLSSNALPDINTVYGQIPKGSVLSYQQKEIEGVDKDIITDSDHKDVPQIPFGTQPLDFTYVLTAAMQNYLDGLSISDNSARQLERATIRQSQSKMWHSVRHIRLTSSQFKPICSRQKDFESLAKRLSSPRSIQTAAMKHGIAQEPHAAKLYSEITGNNVYLSGFIVNPHAPHLGASPDRYVYDVTTGSYGLLEIKCPQNASYTQCAYLQKAAGEVKLKMTHDYYYQIMGQLGISGFLWADFMIKCDNDFHLERIYFDRGSWASMKEKLDKFYIEYYMPQLVKEQPK